MFGFGEKPTTRTVSPLPVRRKGNATRISYKNIAAALLFERPPYNEVGEVGWDIWKRTVFALTDALQAGNPHFNRARFLEAAGAL